ncbi:MAG: bifunctional diaminohydroxyphosphoribosylaminopyrimidine deaminase/5-amino-6-(5-phosphoribosylamino)uracil reductase RibD [Bacteroidetes bacterium]|jgi:diaminohydroxyphosphoribosylaminopyrimidine deaminase/5-amino-6-(5-phosphoribosylamino)uracil reductase|nr:bifunctional diaminohydroxyphosphoribosylaminopyrimidine deaminase/5-amino-6-(5-phosphoribosylamino)uracil reductase RibD [Bacteroidota bacterium]
MEEIKDADKIWMQKALSLAEKGRGYVSPNPMVGAVIVSKEGDIIGEGYHRTYGGDHAEVAAVRSVVDKTSLKAATIYVTLEPCAHHGKTPPCAEMLADLPLKRVVIAMKDPFTEVDGKGIQILEKSGLTVDVGVLEEDARELNEAWLHYLSFNQPFVTLKIAQTADGYIAAPNGDSKWISSNESRTMVHRWRSRQDAVLVGRNTAMLDNPSLTVRLVEGRQPRRVVIDGPLELPANLNLFSDQYEEKTIIVTYNKKKASDKADPMLKMLQSNYFRGEMMIVNQHNGHTDLQQMLTSLAEAGVTSLLVEGGRDLSSAFLRGGFADRLQLFVAPKILGGGTKSIQGLGMNRMEDLVPFKRTTWTRVGPDILLTADL